jgi:hypothetical protein
VMFHVASCSLLAGGQDHRPHVLLSTVNGPAIEIMLNMLDNT